LQSAVNRRTGARIQVLRQLGIAMIAGNGGAADERSRIDDRRIEKAFALDMGIFKLKFSMNFLMNVCNHLQINSALSFSAHVSARIWSCTASSSARACSPAARCSAASPRRADVCEIASARSRRATSCRSAASSALVAAKIVRVAKT